MRTFLRRKPSSTTEAYGAQIARSLASLERVTDPDLVARAGLELIAEAVGASQAVLLLTPDTTGALRISALTGIEDGHVPALQSKALPELSAAILQGSTQVFDDVVELAALRDSLGVEGEGPGLLSPAALAPGRRGAVVLLGHAEWTQDDLERVHAWTDYMSLRYSGQTGRLTWTSPSAGPDEAEMLRAQLRLALQELAEAQAVPTDPPAAGSLSAALLGMQEPLTSVRGYLDLVVGGASGEVPPDQSKFLSRIRKNTDELERLLHEAIETLNTPVAVLSDGADLRHAIETAADQVSGAAEAKRIEILVDLPELAPRVSGEAALLRRIVAVMLENAIDASPSGAEITLSVEHTPGDTWLALSVGDSGEGLPPEDLGRVFHGGDAMTSELKALAGALHGRVWIESEVGSGSVVTVLLPVSENDAE